MLYKIHHIAGVDEAGRGPWAGPVSVAAVILNPAHPIAGLNDSKQLKAHQREALFEVICKNALAVSAVFVSAIEVDRLNIRAATLHGMVQAVQGLALTPHEVLIDGRDVPPAIAQHFSARAIIGGDGLEAAISAASIVAKVLRDRAMRQLDGQFPGYGFAVHKGYGTPQHMRTLADLGPCALHRKSFAPIRKLLYEG